MWRRKNTNQLRDAIQNPKATSASEKKMSIALMLKAMVEEKFAARYFFGVDPELSVIFPAASTGTPRSGTIREGRIHAISLKSFEIKVHYGCDTK